MQTEQLRALLLEYLGRAANDRYIQLRYRGCVDAISSLVKERHPEEMAEEGGRRFLTVQDQNRIKHVIWDLILDRVLIPGTENPEASNDGWPFLSLTDHGRDVVASQRPTPYDPDGYLKRLRASNARLHQTVEAYLAESLSTLRTGNPLASAVMLGAASEMLFSELCGAIADGFANSTERQTFEGNTGYKKTMVDRVNAVNSWLSQKRKQLPRDWQDPQLYSDNYFSGLTTIRIPG